MGTKADRNVETRKPDGQAAGGTDLPSSASSSSTGSDTELGNGAPLAIGRTRRCWKCGCQSRRLPRYFAARRRPTKPSAHTKCKPPHKMEDGISCQPPICTTSHASAHVSDGHSSAVAGAQKGLGWYWSAGSRWSSGGPPSPAHPNACASHYESLGASVAAEIVIGSTDQCRHRVHPPRQVGAGGVSQIDG